MRQRATLGGALMALALVIGACGIPVSQSAHTASSRGLNPVLSGATPTPTTTPKPPSVKTEHSNHLEIYLVDGSGTHLVPVQRIWGTHVSPSVALNVLALGPYPKDTHRGLQTDLGAAPHLSVAVNRHDVATVTLDPSAFSELFGASLYVPLAQIVFTLMDNFSSIKGVDFYLAADPPELFNYTPDGSVVLRPVTEQSYAALKPLPTKKNG